MHNEKTFARGPRKERNRNQYKYNNATRKGDKETGKMIIPSQSSAC